MLWGTSVPLVAELGFSQYGQGAGRFTNMADAVTPASML